MTKIRKKTELPNGFELTRYDQFLDCTNDELFFEAAIRAELYTNAENHSGPGYLDDAMRVLEAGDLWIYRACRKGMVLSKNPDGHEKTPFVSGLLDREAMRPFYPEFRDDVPPLPMTVAVQPINGQILIALLTDAMNAGVVKPVLNVPGMFVIDQKFRTLSVAEVTGSPRLDISLNLAATDKQILSELGEQLPVLRQRLSIPEPDIRVNDRDSQAASSAMTRIIKYKVIPMLDLMLWRKHRVHKKYTAPQLIEILFPDGKDGKAVETDEIYKTLGRFVKKYLSNHKFQDQCILWLNDKGEDGKFNGQRSVRDELLYHKVRKESQAVKEKGSSQD